MIRTLNFTDRKSIRKEHVRITVRPGALEAPPTFDAHLKLESYGFPRDARVFVEAYRQSAYQRFAFATIENLESPEDRALTEFGTGDGVLFRVKVDGPEGDPSDPKPARLLGEALQIRPRFAGRRKSLLAIEPGEFRDQVWLLETAENSDPLLYVSKHLAPNSNALAKKPEFVSLVLPEIFRRVLGEALSSGADPDDSPDHWACKWVRLAVALTGNRESPWELEEGKQAEWIAEAVRGFAHRYRVAERFKKWDSRES